MLLIMQHLFSVDGLDKHGRAYQNKALFRELVCYFYVCIAKKVGGNQQVGLNLTTVELELGLSKLHLRVYAVCLGFRPANPLTVAHN